MSRDKNHKLSFSLVLVIALALSGPMVATASAAQPTVTATSVTAATQTTAHLQGAIDSKLKEVTAYRFQFITQAAWEADGESFGAGTGSAPVPPGTLPAKPKATGELKAGSTTVTNLVLPEEGALAPGQSISGPGIPSGTTILALEPGGLTLSKAATATSASPVTLTATGPQPVAADISGLQPATRYRFRILAENTDGETPGPERSFTTVVPPQAFGPCPNDAFRSGEPSALLPDCRAYEQASPVDKNGGDVSGDVTYVKTSPDGSRAVFLTTSPIPGAEGAAEFYPPYLASRGPGGWTSQGLYPPQAEGQYAQLDSWTPDLSTTYSWARRVVERSGDIEPFQTTLLARSSDGAGLQAIVPHTLGLGTPTVAGTSEDGSVVFFETTGAPGPLLPGVPKERPNLFVWDRATGAYRPAGVFNDGSAPPGGSFAGPYSWIEGNLNIGGAKRKYDTRDQHAISPDGKSVYFTAAGTGQLYLRLNPTAAQSPVINEGEPDEECTDPELACTLHVSASHKTNGGPGHVGPDPAGPQPAAFLGAAADGSSAFFMSSEKLTNDANTGPEQPPAQIGKANSATGALEDASFLPRHALGLATSPDGRYLYWVDPSKQAIARADLEAPDPEATIEDEYVKPGPVDYEVEPGMTESVPSTPRYVAVGPCAEGGECVYWTNRGKLDPSNGVTLPGAGTIGRAKVGATHAEEPEPDFIRGATGPEGIAVNSSHIYWANAPTGIGLTGIARAAISGEAGTVFFGTAPQTPSGVALSPTHVYFGSNEDFNDNGYIERIPLEGGARENFAVDKAGVRSVAVDAEHVYWASQGEEAVGRIPLGDYEIGSCEGIPTCNSSFITPKPEGAPTGLATDGTHLYYSTNAEAPGNPGRDLYRFDAGSGALTDLTPDPSGDGAEVQGLLGSSEDGSFVYFVANGVFGSAPEAGSCRLSNSSYAGSCNLYVDHEGQVDFIARLKTGASKDQQNWQPISDARTDPRNLRSSRVSPDGHTLLFRSAEQLTSYENAGVPELYRYRFGEPGSILCVSCNPTGVAPVGDRGPGLGSIGPNIEAANISSAVSLLSRNLSEDGDRVFFETDEALVAADTNGAEGCPPLGNGSLACQDVYEWEAKGTGSCESEVQNGGCLYLLSAGSSPEASYFADASAGGEDAFIFTRSRLVPQDQDSFQDLYDVRAGGGLASQNQPPPPVPCEGETCKGGAASVPPVSSPATNAPSDPGNVKPGPPRCGKGKHQVKRHGKTICVKKTKKPKKHTKTNKHGRNR